MFNFKQRFLAKGYHEGGNSYFGKKDMLWWGAGVYVKPDIEQDAKVHSRESTFMAAGEGSEQGKCAGRW